MTGRNRGIGRSEPGGIGAEWVVAGTRPPTSPVHPRAEKQFDGLVAKLLNELFTIGLIALLAFSLGWWLSSW